MEYKIPVNIKNYHKAILMILNFNLNLSKMELDIVACILNHNMESVDLYSRETIRKELNKDKFIINNYIARLKTKKILIVKPADKKLYVNPNIIEIAKDRKLTFEFIIDGNN